PIGSRRALAAGRGEQSERLDFRIALAVGVRPEAARLARRELARVTVVVEPADQAVDPAEAKRLLDRVLVVDRCLAGVRLVEHEPDPGRRAVIRFEPCAPARAAANVERLQFGRHAALRESALNIRVCRRCAKLSPMSNPILGIAPLEFPWQTKDPFLV